MPKLTDDDAKQWIKKHIQACFHNEVPLHLGTNPSEERLTMYRDVFDEMTKEMPNNLLDRFIFFGRICGIIPPAWAETEDLGDEQLSKSSGDRRHLPPAG